MPWEPTLDIMRRTIANLEFVERNARPGGPFEVTQLLNSFLGALAHPWERYRSDFHNIPFTADDGWPRLPPALQTDKVPDSLTEALRLLRNGIAHGNIDFLQGPDGSIRAIRIQNYDRGRRTWGTILTVSDLRLFLYRFVEFAECLGRDAQAAQMRSA